MAYAQISHWVHFTFQFVFAGMNFYRIAPDISAFKSFPQSINQLPVNSPIQIAVIQSLRHKDPDSLDSQISRICIFYFFYCCGISDDCRLCGAGGTS